MPYTAGTSEVEIFSRIVQPGQGSFTIAAANAILALDFSEADKSRVRDLSAKAREGSLASAEQEELNRYERVDHMLALLKSKARDSLKERKAKDH
jgi:hypothetical protein